MKFFLFFVMTAFICQVTRASVIHVPADQPDIQSGINIASDGDTVLIADGTYTGDGNRDIDFLGKAIIVKSGNGPDLCIIDIQGSELEAHRGFYFHSGEDSESVLDGLTIQGGYAPETGDFSNGGGILCQNSSPLIIGCTIKNNTVPGGYGGGVFLDQSSADWFECTIINNSAIHRGGGIYCNESSPFIFDCTVANNESLIGGGFYFELSSAVVNNCHISSNSAQYYGGIACSSSDTIILNSLISVNEGIALGGAVGCDDSSPRLINCVITGNSSFMCGGVVVSAFGAPIIKNSILWNNENAEISIWENEGDPDVTYSLIEGGFEGIGNIDGDPLFVAGPLGEFYLSQVAAGQSQDSPCLDAGADLSQLTCFETFDGETCMDKLTTRTDDVFDLGMVDMGIHYTSTLPTYTPSPTPSPTPTPTATPTVSPTPDTCQATGVTLEMPGTHFVPGDTFACSALVCNRESDNLTGYPLFVILDVYGTYFFAPSFNSSFDNFSQQYPAFSAGETSITVLPEFTWPAAGSGQATFYGALTDPDMTSIFGEWEMFPFSWSE